MVRRITETDIPHVMALSKRCYDEMQFDDFGYLYDPEQILKSWTMSINGFPLRGYITEDGDGLFLVSITDITAYFTGKRIAQEIVFHADPALSAMRKIKIMSNLLSYVINDLRDIGVRSLYVNSDVRYDAISKLIQHKGFKPVSIAHYLEV